MPQNLLVITLSIISINFLLGVLVLANGRRERLDQVFFGLFMIWTSFAGGAAVMLTFSPDLLWGRMLNGVGGTAGIPLLLFAYSLERKSQVKMSKAVLTLILLLLFLLPALSFSPLSVKGAQTVGGVFRPIPGSLYIVDQLISIGLILWGVTKVLSLYRKLTGQTKLQLQYLILGLVLLFVAGLAINTVFPRFGITAPLSMSPALLLLLTVPTVYAILRHRLFDIRVVLQKGITVVTLAAVSLLLYFFIFRIIERVAPEEATSLTSLAIIVTLVLIVLAGFQVVRIFQQATERIFFRRTYLYRETLDRITYILNRIYSVEDFCAALTKTIANIFRSNRAAFLLHDEKKEVFAPVYASGVPNHGALTFKVGGKFVEYSRNEEDIFLLEEAKEQGGLTGEVVKELESQKVELFIPIRIRERLEGIICLGEKGSGNPYAIRDINLLEVVSHQAGVALENAKLYSSLEEKVKERTKALKETQKRELEKARDIARLKDEFFFIATHELRTPAVAMSGFLELVSGVKEKFPKGVRENLEFMEQANEHLKQLINDLLEISREEAGTLTVEVEPHEFAPILKEVMDEVSPLIEKKGLNLTVEMAKVPLVLCDREKLKEVLANLVSNAIKYNREKGEIDISAYQHPGEDSLVIEIRDTGYGVPKEKQKEIFKKFSRARTEGTKEVLGTGLGLFITRILVEKMGGKIKFSSVEGKGSTFTFSLPLAKEESRKKGKISK